MRNVVFFPIVDDLAFTIYSIYICLRCIEHLLFWNIIQAKNFFRLSCFTNAHAFCFEYHIE